MSDRAAWFIATAIIRAANAIAMGLVRRGGSTSGVEQVKQSDRLEAPHE